MNLTWAHIVVVVTVLICTVTMGADHVIRGEQVSNILIACIASLSGHAVGYAASVQAENKGDHRR